MCVSFTLVIVHYTYWGATECKITREKANWIQGIPLDHLFYTTLVHSVVSYRYPKLTEEHKAFNCKSVTLAYNMFPYFRLLSW